MISFTLLHICMLSPHMVTCHMHTHIILTYKVGHCHIPHQNFLETSDQEVAQTVWSVLSFCCLLVLKQNHITKKMSATNKALVTVLTSYILNELHTHHTRHYTHITPVTVYINKNILHNVINYVTLRSHFVALQPLCYVTCIASSIALDFVGMSASL